MMLLRFTLFTNQIIFHIQTCLRYNELRTNFNNQATLFQIFRKNYVIIQIEFKLKTRTNNFLLVKNFTKIVKNFNKIYT